MGETFKQLHTSARLAVLRMPCRHRHAAAVVISGKRHRQHFHVANASDRLHCDNVPKLSIRRLFLITMRRAAARVDLQEA